MGWFDGLTDDISRLGNAIAGEATSVLHSAESTLQSASSYVVSEIGGVISSAPAWLPGHDEGMNNTRPLSETVAPDRLQTNLGRGMPSVNRPVLDDLIEDPRYSFQGMVQEDDPWNPTYDQGYVQLGTASSNDLAVTQDTDTHVSLLNPLEDWAKSSWTSARSFAQSGIRGVEGIAENAYHKIDNVAEQSITLAEHGIDYAVHNPIEFVQDTASKITDGIGYVAASSSDFLTDHIFGNSGSVGASLLHAGEHVTTEAANAFVTAEKTIWGTAIGVTESAGRAARDLVGEAISDIIPQDIKDEAEALGHDLELAAIAGLVGLIVFWPSVKSTGTYVAQTASSLAKDAAPLALLI